MTTIAALDDQRLPHDLHLALGTRLRSGTLRARLVSAGRSPFLLLDMTTTASGLLCWRDFHPLERQLASLHLFDDLVGATEQRYWYCDAKRLGSLEIENQLH